MKARLIFCAFAIALSGCGEGDDLARPSSQTSSMTSSQASAFNTQELGAPSPGDSGFFYSDGIKIFYQVTGHGHPMILVHGWGTSSAINWENTGWVDKLKNHRKVITIDIRGHGKSEKPHVQSVYSYSLMAHDVLGLMDHLGIEKADFIGYSMGSFIGAYLLGHHSDRFTSMIWGGIGDETPLSTGLSQVIAATLRAGKLIGDFFHVSDPYFDLESLALSCLQMWPEGFPRTLGGPGLMTSAVPVLVINGGEDRPYVETDQDLVKMIPGAQLIRIPGRNHLTTFQDKRFFKAIKKWLGLLNNQEAADQAF